MTDDWPRDEPLILDGVHARRGDVEVLRGISLEFPPGSRTVVIGRSGSGKSTLLRLLNRLSDPSAGEIRVGSRPIASYPVTWLRRKIGLVFQAPRPLPGSVLDNLAYPRRVGTAHHPDADARWAVPTLEEVGLDPSWLDRDAAGLSGGERQRLALAVAFQTDPAILALDEPTSALDPASARRVIEALRHRSERDGLTTIAVTHSREYAAWLGDRAVVLDAGRVIDQGPTADVLDRADGAFWAGSEAP
jgi:putative ABC transport system ATP-binding protein